MYVADHIDANTLAAGLFVPQTKPRIQITQRRWIGLKCYQHGARSTKLAFTSACMRAHLMAGSRREHEQPIRYYSILVRASGVCNMAV